MQVDPVLGKCGLVHRDKVSLATLAEYILSSFVQRTYLVDNFISKKYSSLTGRRVPRS